MPTRIPVLLICVLIRMQAQDLLPSTDPLPAEEVTVDTVVVGNAAPADDRIELVAGGGLQWIWWEAEATVDSWAAESSQRQTLATTSYDISDTFFLGAHCQARIGSTHIGLGYVRSQVADGIDLPDQVSDRLVGLVDVRQLIGENGLRLLFEQGRLAGTATWQTGDTRESVDFSQRHRRLGVHLQGDRFYGGIEYLTLDMPMGIGLSDAQHRVRYLLFDEDFSSDVWMVVGGIDTLSSMSRGARPGGLHVYLDCMAGFMLGRYEVGRDLRRQVQDDGWRLDDGWSYGLTGEARIGVVWLGRERPQGFGGWCRGAIAIRGMFQFDGQSTDRPSQLAEDELSFEWTRWDLLYGPFIEAGLVW